MSLNAADHKKSNTIDVQAPLPSSTDPLKAPLPNGHDPRFEALYGKLRIMARSRLYRHETFTLLGTTAPEHESFLRRARAGGVKGADEPAFLAYASQVMRSVIVDAARTHAPGAAPRRRCRGASFG